VDTQYWTTVETMARELAPRRADAELAQLSAYLSRHHDAADFFALLDDLAGPAGAALAPGAEAGAFAAVRDACQPLRALPPEALPTAVAFAARLLRYQISKLPPAPRPQPVPARAPAAVARPPVGAPPAPSARPQPGRPAAAGAPPGPRPPRPPGPMPAAAERRGPPPPAGPRPAAPPGARPTPPGRPAPPPGERAPVQPAAEQPRPAPPPPRRPATMEEMLRALQAQFSGGPGAGPAEERPRPRAESKAERLRREQEEIRERYRRQLEEDEQTRRG